MLHIWIKSRANIGVGKARKKKQPKARFFFLNRTSCFKMTTLEARMTQIMARGGDIHSFAGWLWLEVGRGNCWGGIYMVKELEMVFRYHPPLQMNHCSVNAALIPWIAKQDEVRHKPWDPSSPLFSLLLRTEASLSEVHHAARRRPGLKGWRHLSALSSRTSSSTN